MDFRNSNEQEELIYLADESGQEMGFHLLDVVMLEESEFLVLLPAEGPYQDEVVILQREKEPDGSESYVDLSDPKTLREVYRIFRDRSGDRFIFTD